jgi:hypothetical protein
MAEVNTRRRVELLDALYRLGPEDGRLTVAATNIGREAGGPEFDVDKYRMIDDGWIELVEFEREGILAAELYMVTPKGKEILRAWSYL